MNNNYIKHYGILGQKWGIRRFQNSDGSLTEAGRNRYLNPDGSLNDKTKYDIAKYKEEQTRATNKLYDRNLRSGFLNLKLDRAGLKSLNRKQSRLETSLARAIMSGNAKKIEANKYSLDAVKASKEIVENMRDKELAQINSLSIEQYLGEQRYTESVVATAAAVYALETIVINMIPGMAGFVVVQPDVQRGLSDYRQKTYTDKNNED